MNTLRLAPNLRTAKRPSELWFELHVIGRAFSVYIHDIMKKIHSHATLTHVDELEGLAIFMDRRERQRRAAAAQGALPPTFLWQDLGFRCREAYEAQRAAEHTFYEGAKLKHVISELPSWKAFGFTSRRAYKQYCIEQRRMSTIR